jgi:secreted trypsin-like serine protease
VKRLTEMKSAIFIALCLFLGVSTAQIEISPFVINGVRAPIAPYYVMVNYFNNEGLGFFGGGALISNRHILTAATNVQG